MKGIIFEDKKEKIQNSGHGYPFSWRLLSHILSSKFYLHEDQHLSPSIF
jgi:hypothetical protein